MSYLLYAAKIYSHKRFTGKTCNISNFCIKLANEILQDIPVKF